MASMVQMQTPSTSWLTDLLSTGFQILLPACCLLWQAPGEPARDAEGEDTLQARLAGQGLHVGMPKVALLFLTRGHLPHENLWAAWFRSAAGATVSLSAIRVFRLSLNTALSSRSSTRLCVNRQGGWLMKASGKVALLTCVQPAGLLRADCLGELLCQSGASAAESAIARLQMAQAAVPPTQLVSQQSMFSVLVHAPPVFKG